MNGMADVLRGVQLLIVEDEYLLARDMADYFESIGVQIVGPAGTVSDALALINSHEIQAAVLDINLRNERVYPVAEMLTQKQIPFVFASGYGSELDPHAYEGIPRCIKPVDFVVLSKDLGIQLEKSTQRPVDGLP
jgi:CheY-like chemotaxis protein